MDHRITESLDRLIEGNARFSLADRESRGQPPETGIPPGPPALAAILSCSDPGVPPETLFDLAPGSLYVVRVAGHVLDDSVLGSLAYAADVMRVPLIVVLGHDNCRAVRSAVDQTTAAGSIGAVLDAIEPAVLRARNHGASPGDLLAEATLEHVKNTMANLHSSRVLHPLMDQGLLELRGAVYHEHIGVVEWLPR